MTIRTLALIAVAGTGCFHPQYDHPTCGPGGACPSGLSCVNDVCVSSSGLPGDRDATTRDDAATDAAMIDATPGCSTAGLVCPAG